MSWVDEGVGGHQRHPNSRYASDVAKQRTRVVKPQEALLQVAAALQALPGRVQAADERRDSPNKRDDGRYVLSVELRKKQLKAARA